MKRTVRITTLAGVATAALAVGAAQAGTPPLEPETLGPKNKAATADEAARTRVAGNSRARAQIEEIELQIIEAEQKVVLDAQKEIRDIDAWLDESGERRQGGEDRPARIGPPQRDTRTIEQGSKSFERRSGGRS